MVVVPWRLDRGGCTVVVVPWVVPWCCILMVVPVVPWCCTVVVVPWWLYRDGGTVAVVP